MNLGLSGTQVTDAGLQQLKRLKELKILRLADTDTTVAGRKDLRKALPGLKFVLSPIHPAPHGIGKLAWGVPVQRRQSCHGDPVVPTEASRYLRLAEHPYWNGTTGSGKLTHQSSGF